MSFCNLNNMNKQEFKRIQKAEVKDFETKLIIEVKSHICLYAKNDPSYSNKTKRQDAWEDISSILHKTVEECQKKWTSLRDSFRTYFKIDSNIPSGSGAPSSIRWVHFQSLRFLVPYVKVPADDCGNFSDVFNPIMESSPSMDISQAEEILDATFDEDIPSSIQSTTTSRPKRVKKRKTNEDEPFERVLMAIENCGKRKPMEAFFDSIAQQVEHFSAGRQIKLQRKILDILAEELMDA